MPQFDETRHRRADDGKFSTKPVLGASAGTVADVEAAANDIESLPPIRPVKVRNGCYQIDSTIPDPELTDEPNVKRIHLVSEPAHRARLEATASAYDRPDDLTEQLEDAADNNRKVGLLRKHRDSITGAQRVLAEEVTMVRAGDGRLAYLRKGARSRGTIVQPDDVLDMRDGWNGSGDELTAAYRQSASEVPPMQQIDQTDLDGVPEADPNEPPPSDVALTVFGTHPGFQGGNDRTAGCVWFVTDYDKKNDIANGYMWASSDSGLYSEHGSVTGKQLRSFGGKSKTPNGMTFGDAMGLPGDRASVWGMLR